MSDVPGFDRLRPLYEQVKERLRVGIDSGELAEGEFLPPEPQLCDRFGVSRITLRRAVAELCEEGVLLRQQGRGTVVTRRKLQQHLVELHGFAEALGRAGEVVHRVLDRADGLPGGEIGVALGLGAGAALVRFTRLILLGGDPFTLEQLHFDADRFPGVPEVVEAGGSFFRALREQHGLEPQSARRLIDVGFPSSEERRHLQVSASQPVYRMQKTVFDRAGVGLSWSRLITPTHLVTYQFDTRIAP